MASDTEPEPTHPEDLDLARRAARGEPAAVAVVCYRLRCIAGTLRGWNARYGQALDAEELRDLAQDVILALWPKLETFRGLATLETWARRFCAHVYRNRVRRRRPVLPSDGVLPERPCEDRDAAAYAELESALQTLGPPEEDVLRLKQYEGLTFEEIGRRLGCSPNTAKTRYYRGLRWMRDHLEGSEAGS